MIELRNVTKRFDKRVAVHDLTMSVGEGEILGLLGPNGAGKTTVMRMITGYLPPSEGLILIDGKDMFDQPVEVKRRTGYLPEHPPLYMDLTVNEYLFFAGQLHGLKGPELGKRVEYVARLCDIQDSLGRLNGNLSKGYRQRVGLAQALIHDPKVLVLDEPTSGLDPKQITEIRELIKELGRDRTVIISSHILKEVTSVCTTIAILNRGKLLAFDTIGNLSQSGRSVQTVMVTVERPDRIDIGKLETLEHVVSVRRSGDRVFHIDTEVGFDLRDAISSAVVESGAGLLQMGTESMNLEEIFLKIIAGGEEQ